MEDHHLVPISSRCNQWKNSSCEFELVRFEIPTVFMFGERRAVGVLCAESRFESYYATSSYILYILKSSCNCAGWCRLPQKLGNSPWRAIVLACEVQICKSHSFASFIAGVSNEYKVLLTCPGAAMRQGTDFCLWTSGRSFWRLGPVFDSFPCILHGFFISILDTNLPGAATLVGAALSATALRRWMLPDGWCAGAGSIPSKCKGWCA